MARVKVRATLIVLIHARATLIVSRHVHASFVAYAQTATAGIPVDQQRLVFASRQREDHKTMGELAAAVNEDLSTFEPTFHLVIRTGGPGYLHTTNSQDQENFEQH